MKKFLKIIFINLFLCTILLCIAEFACIFFNYIQHDHTEYTFSSHLKNIWSSYFDTDYYKNYEYRKPSEPTNKEEKLPIAVMGCSFTYGMGLEEHETISAQLAKVTGRKVYNAGIVASSPRDILYILRTDKHRIELLGKENNLEYIIYPYIAHHLFRLYNETRILSPSPKFKKKENSLEYYKTKSVLFKTQLYKKTIEVRYHIINGKESFELMKLYLTEINKEIKKNYPNAQFVVLVYDENGTEDWDFFEKHGIQIVKVINLTKSKNLLENEYRLPDNKHPNAKAWEEIVPLLSEKLNL